MYIMSAVLSEICQNTESEYEKAQAMFDGTQKCSNTSSWSDPAIEARPQTRSFASNQMPDEPESQINFEAIDMINHRQWRAEVTRT